MNRSTKTIFRIGSTAATVGVAMIFWGCAPTADTQQIQSDQFTMRGLIASDQQQIDALQEKIQRLNDRVAELEHNSAGGSAGNQQLAALQQRVAKLESEVTPAQAGANPAAPGTPPPDDTGGSSGMAGPNEGEGAAAPSSEGASPEVASAPSWRAMLDQELTASYDDPAAKLYHAGLVDLKAGNDGQALAQLQNLQRHYPKSDLSEPAEFFSANALYEMGKYDQSILQFNDLTMRFPKGKFASAALLREAQAFMKINDRIDARLTLQKLLSDHPDSPEAPQAKSMMQTLA
jgi:TolA-binding protein